MAKKRNPGSKKPGVKKKKASRPATAGAAATETASATIEGKAQEMGKKKSVSPLEFMRQVRSEGEKVTWTSRNETMVSTLMVLVMVAIMAIFFLLVDQALRFAVGALLSVGVE
ncbi:MAG: preprotein translocase subunit SecE [Pseudomonadota bacterium]